MKRRKKNPQTGNRLLFLACVILFLILATLLVRNHLQEAQISNELEQKAVKQVEIEQSEKDKTWTGDQNQGKDTQSEPESSQQ